MSNPMLAQFSPLLESFAASCATYAIAAASAAEATSNGNQPFKAWLSTLQAETSYVDPTLISFVKEFTDDATLPEQLLAMRNALQASLETINDLLETHFVAARKATLASTSDQTETLDETYAALKSQFKGFRGFIDANLLSIEEMQSFGVPVELAKKGRALEAQPTLNIPRPPKTAPRLRANSKRYVLVVDGTEATEDNLSASILARLNISFEAFRTAFGTYEENKSVTINGHAVSLKLIDEN